MEKTDKKETPETRHGVSENEKMKALYQKMKAECLARSDYLFAGVPDAPKVVDKV